MITVKETGDRKTLTEGRQHGLGFAFCKKISDTEFETVQPISACKDYLNDVVFSEITGLDYYAYGFSSKKEGIFDGTTSYLVMRVLPHKYIVQGYGAPGYYLEKDRLAESVTLASNIVHIIELMNYVEDQLKVEGRTNIEQADGDKWLIYVPYWWCRSSVLISLYSLIVRMGLTYDGSMSPEVFLEDYDHKSNADLWNPTKLNPNSKGGAKPKYEHFVKHGPIVVDMLTLDYTESGYSNKSAVHNYGIVGLQLDEEKVDII
jgi:hypothetical protein